MIVILNDILSVILNVILNVFLKCFEVHQYWFGGLISSRKA